MDKNNASKSKDELIRELQIELEEAEETLQAIQNGEIDAIVTQTPDESKIYTLEGADQIYRLLIQDMSDGVATLTPDGTIFFCNSKLASLIQLPMKKIIGRKLTEFFDQDNLEIFQNISSTDTLDLKSELNLKSIAGTIIPVSISIKTLSDLKGSYAVITDLREQKYYEELQKTQQELLVSNKDLRETMDELKNQRQALQEANDTLEFKVKERTKELSNERMRFFDVLETLPIMVCLLTDDYHVAFANRAFRDRFGESEGRYCYDYCFGKSEPCEFCETYTVFETGKPHQWEVNAPDGSIIEAYDFPFTDVDGTNLILEMDIDVTIQRQAEDSLKNLNKVLEEKVNERTIQLQISEKNYRNIIDNLQDAYMRGNNEGFITMVSPSAAHMYGFNSSEEMIGIPNISLYKNSDDRGILLKELRKYGKLVDYESEGLRTDGTSFPVSMNVQFYYNQVGKIEGTEVFVRDMTTRKKAERLKEEMFEKEQQLTEELSATNEELQATSEELQTSNEELIIAHDGLNDMVNKLKTSNKELEQFAYVASHDLQEPLRMVSSFTQLLERRYKDKLDADADDYIEFIVEGSQRMKYLIDDLLTFSRLNTVVREFENILLDVVLDDVLINLKASIMENNAEITNDSLPSVMGDYAQINQLLQNLISNAIKFHGDDPPKIHISTKELEKEWLISVDDNGIGIDPTHQKQIFRIFKRLHTREEYPGTGIGLAICKRIVERHNGQIWVESERGVGSTFYFTLPKN